VCESVALLVLVVSITPVRIDQRRDPLESKEGRKLGGALLATLSFI
jgi:hypothetical protein